MTEANQLRAIHPQCLNRRLTSWCQRDDFCRIFTPGKVLAPRLMLRVKQSDSLTALLGNACLSIRFVTITTRTSQAEVMRFGFTPRAPRDNVIDFKNGDAERLSGLTIGAAMSELGSDLTPQGTGHVSTHDVCN
jgi:hypothetical protein